MRLARLVVCASLLAPTACGRIDNRAERVQAVADSADQLMIGVRLNLTNEGVRNAYLEGDTAFVYENSGHTNVKKVRLTFYTPEGVQTSYLTSDSGWYRMRTGEMEALGNVVVTRTDGAKLTTSVLHYDQARNEVSTDQPYTYITGDRHVVGNGFVSDPTFSNITSKNVHGTAGHFTLPGQ